MSTAKVINIVHPSGTTTNIVNDASGNITLGGNVTLSGTAVRITGDMSNATLASRVAFQTSTVNGITTVAALPNGTQTISSFSCYNNATPSSGQVAQLIALSTEMRLTSAPDSLSTYLPMTFHTGGSERMRLDTSGNASIGASSSGGFKLSVNATAAGSLIRATDGVAQSYDIGTTATGAYVNNPNSGYLAWQIGGAEKARIDTTGSFLFNCTNPSQTVEPGFKVAAAGVTATVTAASTAGTNFYHLYSTGAAAYRFYVGAAGTVFATSATISAISDQRLKENVRDLDVGLNAVMSLKPRKFDWKEGKGKNIKDDRGFIAQEFEQVFPDLIDEWKDELSDGGQPYKAVRADLIPVLVRAIQEQQATITALTARVAALEAK